MAIPARLRFTFAPDRRAGPASSGVLCMGLACLVLCAGQANGEVERGERLTFDPQTEQWRRVAEPIPGTPDGDLDLARRLVAQERYPEALKALEKWIKTYGAEPDRYPEALYLKASCLLETGEYRDAHDAYSALLNDFPGSIYAERALSGEFRVAEQYLAGKRKKIWGGLLRFKNRDGGVEILDDMIVNYADTPLAEKAQRAKADYYFSRGEFELAEDEYAVFTRDYPRSRWHPYALLQSARAALASFPGVKFDDAPLLEAQERFTEFLRTYPDQARELDVPVLLDEIANRRAEKTLEIARFYDKTRQINAARYYYRQTAARWPDSPAALQARARLEALGGAVEQPLDEAAADTAARTGPSAGGASRGGSGGAPAGWDRRG